MRIVRPPTSVVTVSGRQRLGSGSLISPDAYALRLPAVDGPGRPLSSMSEHEYCAEEAELHGEECGDPAEALRGLLGAIEDKRWLSTQERSAVWRGPLRPFRPDPKARIPDSRCT